jgi:hypothetical protein
MVQQELAQLLGDAMTAITIPLSGLKESRVWIDESPIDGGGTIAFRRSVKADSDVPVESRRIVVEVMVPVGFPMYGLLGASIDPSAEGFEILVKSASSDGVIYPQSLLSPDVDEVRVGLCDEYVDAVSESLQQGLLGRLGTLPRARLTFDIAAHGAAGSNNHVFRKLADVVFESLLSGEPTTFATVQRLLEAAF